MKSSYVSSGFTVVKFSCKMAIFFSLSQPAGLWKELKESFVFWATEITDIETTCSEKMTQTIQVYILLFSEPASMLQVSFI